MTNHIITLCLLLCLIKTNAQSNMYDNYHAVNSTQVRTYQGMSDEDLKLKAYSEYLKEQNFQKYFSLADEAYKRNDYYSCISYSQNALETGYESPYIYYLRGQSYLNLKETSLAKKNFRKAKRLGDLNSKQILNNWRSIKKLQL